MKKLNTIISEASLSRVWQHVESDRPFAILTAFRDEYTAEENQQRNISLAAQIKRAGYGYFYLDGHWIENEGTAEEVEVSEDSVFAIGNPKNHQKFSALIKNLGKQYDQEAVVIKANDEILVHWLTTGGHEVLNNLSAGVLGSVYSKLRNNKKSNTFIFENERNGKGYLWHVANSARKGKS